MLINRLLLIKTMMIEQFLKYLDLINRNHILKLTRMAVQQFTQVRLMVVNTLKMRRYISTKLTVCIMYQTSLWGM
jgi:hypothetical protein